MPETHKRFSVAPTVLSSRKAASCSPRNVPRACALACDPFARHPAQSRGGSCWVTEGSMEASSSRDGGLAAGPAVWAAGAPPPTASATPPLAPLQRSSDWVPKPRRWLSGLLADLAAQWDDNMVSDT